MPPDTRPTDTDPAAGAHATAGQPSAGARTSRRSGSGDPAAGRANANRPPSGRPAANRPTAGVQVALVVGPGLLLAGEVLLALPDAWTAGHAVFLAGALAMLPAAAALHRLLAGTRPRWLRGAGLALSALGALALAGQFLIDFLVARLAADQDAVRSALFDQLEGAPLIFLTLYAVGPALLFTGLAASGAALRGRPGWLLVAGTLLAALARIVDQRLLEVAAGAVILLALLMVVREFHGYDRCQVS